MTKKLVIIACFLFATNFAIADIGYGIRGGVNFSSLSNKEEVFGNYKLVGEPDNYFGFHVGGSTKFDVAFLFIQPEVLFTSVGSFLHVEDISEDATIDDRVYFKQSTHKIDIPLYIGYEYGPIRVGAGPVYSMIIGGTNNYDESELGLSYEQTYHTSSLAYQVGVGLGLGNLIIDLKYEGGLTGFGDTVTLGEVSKQFDSRPGQIILSIGLMLDN